MIGCLAWFLNLTPIVQITAYLTGGTVACVFVREIVKWGRPVEPKGKR